ncbi:hypothetical protein BKA69DRAFT_1128163 [Paraphysoderma sedebokerense]|nr:hypothetical protein BKA69DRAFT_1128163 [Paraphysoderma sedebokerense]
MNPFTSTQVSYALTHQSNEQVHSDVIGSYSQLNAPQYSPRKPIVNIQLSNYGSAAPNHLQTWPISPPITNASLLESMMSAGSQPQNLQQLPTPGGSISPVHGLSSFNDISNHGYPNGYTSPINNGTNNLDPVPFLNSAPSTTGSNSGAIKKIKITPLEEPQMLLYHHEKHEMDLLAEQTMSHYAFVLQDGKEQYLCPFCSKSFGMKHNLRNHIVIHFHLRPFHCGICDSSFVRRWDLKRHMKIHVRNSKSPNAKNTSSIGPSVPKNGEPQSQNIDADAILSRLGLNLTSPMQIHRQI